MNEYGPSLRIECAHGHERARWWACVCVTCCFWFKGTHLVSLMPDHQPLLFISSVDLPFISPLSFLSPFSPRSCFSLFLGHCQHVAFSGSHGVRLNTLMLLPSCVFSSSVFQDYKMFAIELTTCNFFRVMLVKQRWYWIKASWDYWNTPMV